MTLTGARSRGAAAVRSRTAGPRRAASLLMALAACTASPAAAPAAEAEGSLALAWTVTHYLVAAGPSRADSTRRGIAMFANGEIATVTMAVTVQPTEGTVTNYRMKAVYTFDDGSTMLQEGTGRIEAGTPPRNTQTGDGTITGGTGRFERVEGKFVSRGRGLNLWDTITDFRADIAIRKK